MRKFKELQKEEILNAIEQSTFIANVLKSLDCHDNSYNRKMLEEFMKENNISDDCFKKVITREYYETHPKYCKYCGKQLSYEQRRNDFCNHSCSASFNNQGVCRNKIEHKENHCLYCGKEISDKKKFCNSECQYNYYYEDYINKWKLGLEDGKSGEFGVSKYIRRYLFNKYNCSCQECGWGIVNKYTNKIPLQIHHIDGDCTNNKEENLQLLCPNCHSLTENYGSRNENATRIDNRQRY